jgi:cytochrome c oxidase subunit 2
MKGTLRAASASVLAGAAGCRGVQSALDPAGREARGIAGLWWLFFAVCAAVFLIVIVSFALAVFRRSEEETPDRLARGRLAVTVAVGVTAAILLLFLVVSVSTGREISESAGPDALRIQVIGHQWWWEVHYPANPVSREVVTANEIHVPVGRAVIVELTSSDVIHSFWAPNFHGKKDLIPGQINTHVFHAERIGVFRGQCAEFCGLQHAKMAFTVIAETPEAFSKWYDAQLLPAAEPATPSRARGREVFLSAPCMFCHSVRGTPAFGTQAPDLTQLASRGTIAAGTVANNPGNLAGWIADSQSVKPGNHMPPMALAGEDLIALTDYLQSLR